MDLQKARLAPSSRRARVGPRIASALALAGLVLSGCGAGKSVVTVGLAPSAATGAVAAPSVPTTPPSILAESATSSAAGSAGGGIVCKALNEIVVDMAQVPYKPEAAIAQYALKTLGSASGPDEMSQIAAQGDAIAEKNCPADRNAVLKVANKPTLASMLS